MPRTMIRGTRPTDDNPMVPIPQLVRDRLREQVDELGTEIVAWQMGSSIKFVLRVRNGETTRLLSSNLDCMVVALGLADQVDVFTGEPMGVAA